MKVTAIIIAIILLLVLLYNIFFIVSGRKVSKLLETSGLEVTVSHDEAEGAGDWQDLGYYQLTENQIVQLQDLFKKARFKKYNNNWHDPHDITGSAVYRILNLRATSGDETVLTISITSDLVLIYILKDEDYDFFQWEVSNMHWREFENEFFRICAESELIKEAE